MRPALPLVRPSVLALLGRCLLRALTGTGRPASAARGAAGGHGLAPYGQATGLRLGLGLWLWGADARVAAAWLRRDQSGGPRRT
ncbi:hypothetical protein, partial [Streptomyces botrytidirepellens]|uniref:hypothetical protein n=1 Tax=Streptomyces botrytidirepellens TaxID=2486417 RepID=UPI001C839CB8